MSTSLWESKPKRHVFAIGHKIVTTLYSFPPLPNICGMGSAQQDPDISTTHFTQLSDNHDYGIHEINCRYMLGQQVINEWTRLQQNLHFIAETLFDKPTYALLPSDFTLFPLPSKYGFQHNHKSPEAAHIVGDTSRLAFVPLMGWISYLLTQHLHEKRGVP